VVSGDKSMQRLDQLIGRELASDQAIPMPPVRMPDGSGQRFT
jgi:hypothetical protein